MTSHQIISLIFIGYIVFSIDKKQANFPVPMVLLLLGIGLSFIPYFANIQVTKELIFNWFLPALLFISAYQFPFPHLKKYIGIISVLGTIGLILTSFLLGGILYWVSGFFVSLSFLECLLLAIILTPTDPVSVVPILKMTTKSPKIADVVEGESMLNDGTSIVLFSVVTGLLFTNPSFSFPTVISEFFVVSIGGIIIGLIFGWIVLKGLHLTNHFQYQVMVSITLAYGSFFLAEHFNMSGVLASVASGIIFSWKLDQSGKESELRRSLDGFWGVIEPTILAIIFLIIGIEATPFLAYDNWGFAILIFLFSLFIRFIVLAVILKSFPYWRTSYSINEISLMTWSGIKGTISIVFILSLQAEYNYNENLLVSLSFSAVLLSLVIQSLLIYPLTKTVNKRN